MKNLILLLPLIAAALFTSCASTGSSGTEQLLSAAGFRIKSPETLEQQKIFDQLPAYKVHRGTHDGKIFYAYKDEAQRVAFIGGEKEYQKYQELAVQRRIAQDQIMAAQMNRDLAYGWYGAYRPAYGRFYY